MAWRARQHCLPGCPGGGREPLRSPPPRRGGSRRRGRGFRPGGARVGNTAHSGGAGCGGMVHPRAGGEHRVVTYAAAAYIGSSPRGRGTPRHVQGRRRVQRFIPARAGNTKQPLYGPRRESVHPRAGGEHRRFQKAKSVAIGSSPRGRGTRARVLVAAVFHRFIPARAGNTSAGRRSRHAPPVHPRAGGEHRSMSASM